MALRPRMSVTLVLALSFVAATAFAYVTSAEPQPPVAASDLAPPQVDEEENATAPAPIEPAAAPVTGNPGAVPHIEHYSMPSTVVTAPRPSDDELLRTAVVDRLTADPRLSGRIGVEAYRHVVSLTGRVTTTGQKDRAEQIARSVYGVWEVQNFIHARVGES